MLEIIIAWIKALPVWLAHTVEVLVVAVVFLTAITFLAGIWVGILVINRRARSIESFTLFPFRIEFNNDKRKSTDQESKL
jgi:hypothetical protein